MIDKSIKNIKKHFKALEEILTAKISEKKILYKVLERILTAKIANIKNNFFFVFPMYKRARYKNGSYYHEKLFKM